MGKASHFRLGGSYRIILPVIGILRDETYGETSLIVL